MTVAKNTIVVNLWGGPSAGKSTIAWDLAAAMKRAGIGVELITEGAKDVVHEGHTNLFTNQLVIFAEQDRRQWRVKGQYDYMITDSPSLMGVAYAPPDYYQSFRPLVRQVFDSYTNVNFFIDRVVPYDPVGRYQDETGANEKAQEILTLMNDEGIPYIRLPGDNHACKKILNILLNKAD